MTTGKRISELRKERGITQGQLADKVGVSKSSIGGYERDTKKPSIDVLKRLSEYFGVTTDYLLCKSEFKNSPHHKIEKALEDDPELLQFWNEMSAREDIKLMFKQTVLLHFRW